MEFFDTSSVKVGFPLQNVPHYLRRFATLVEWKSLEERVKSLQRRAQTNYFFSAILRQRYWIEIALQHALERLRNFGRLGKFENLPRYSEAIAFAIVTAQIHDLLSSRGKARLLGMLRDGVQSEKGLGPLQFEISTATHFFQLGYQLHFKNFEDGSGFDYLIRDGDTYFEVECKNISPDAGLKITSGDLAFLGEHLSRCAPRIPQLEGVTLARFQLRDRLERSSQRCAEMTEALLRALKDSVSHLEGADFTLEIRRFEDERLLAENPSEEGLRNFASKQLGQVSPACLAYGKAGRYLLMVLVTSQRSDSVLRTLIKEMRTATKVQFSTTRPAVLCVKFSSTSAADMLRIARNQGPTREEANGLQVAANFILKRRDFVHSILFVAGEMEISERRSPIIGAPREIRNTSPYYGFFNHEGRFASAACRWI